MTDETKTPEVAVDAVPAKTPTDAPGAAPTLSSIPRSRQQIRVDYTNTAAQLGNLCFQLELMKAQRQAMYNKLDALGLEESQLPPEAKKIEPPRLVPTPPKAGSDGV